MIVEVVRKAIVVREMSQYVLNTSTNVLSQFCPRRRPPTWISREEHLPSNLAVDRQHIGQEEDN